MLVIPFRTVNAVFGKCQDAQHQEVHNGSFRTSVHNIKPKDTVLCKQIANKIRLLFTQILADISGEVA